LDQMQKNAFGGGGPADIPGADEQDPNLVGQHAIASIG
jgi:hypothetical protein